ncbi:MULTISPECIES: ORF6C domain-containing protein [Cellulosilyticum]|uniref:Prophage antirepressor n=1 Tax=Cellulosilyticum lentocellum (strain ATCC 49066 / DSM 5427 / NCIMB 11756 / RHM5) TaxID=642492 RepID=F2JK83_CELLD|nr:MULTISPECIES: ORF6C domain-containing protein [Cellulosilyticum]ADZ84498.1 prophage antirepressor [Cellulosilyticum lentocellum DSM 5427]QEH69948.1 hypothetical protein EKH84_16720 [Cellulosilyticum sp. WCF-2]
MQELMIFEGKQVEVFEFQGKVLFNPKHVAECLGIKNVNDNISRMNENQVIKLKNSDIGKTDIRKLNNAGENFLTESGVYKLIFKSHKEEAERFQDWVTDVVLTSIRKTGTYSTGQKPTSAMEELRMHYRALEEHSQEIQEVKAEVADLKDNMPLFNVECKEIQSLVKKTGTKVLGGYKSNAYNDNSLRGKVYSDIQKQLRREFGVEKYEAIKRSQFDVAKQIVDEYKAPTVLIQEINLLNSQTTLFDKK